MSAAEPRIAPEARALLQRYLDELARWNRRINLTAVPVEAYWSKHVEEVVALLDACAAPQGARIVDVGSGGGVPGVPIAVLRPDVHVVLVESDQRKAAFLTHVAGVVASGSIAVVAQRAEELGHQAEMREAFDVAVSRALAPPAVMCELALPLVRVGGVVATLVGDAAQAARDCAHAASLLGGGAPRTAPGEVLLIDKVAPTPDTYPRRPGVPLRRPLQ